jgi:allantoin racemase
MKLLYLVPGEGLDEKELERRTQVLRENAFTGTEVNYVYCKNGVASIESNYEDSLVAPTVIQAAIQAEKDGYDGILIGCAGDPGLYGAREMVNIPVVGPGENAVHLATMLGNRFSVVAITDSCVPRHVHLVRRAGIACDRLASVRAANISVLDVGRDPDIAKRRVTEEALIARDKDGADCVILGCLSLAFQLFDRELSQVLGIPVINPAIAGLKQLEGIVSTKISHSKKAYQVPPKYRKK